MLERVDNVRDLIVLFVVVGLRLFAVLYRRRSVVFRDQVKL